MGSILAQCVKVAACFTLFSPTQSCLLVDLSLSSYKRLQVTKELERKILKKNFFFFLTEYTSLQFKDNYTQLLIFTQKNYIYLFTYCLFQL